MYGFKQSISLLLLVLATSFGGGVAGCLLVLRTTQRKPTQEVKAERFTVIDGQGNVKGSFGLEGEDSVTLTLYSAPASPAIVLRSHAVPNTDAVQNSFVFLDTSGRELIELNAGKANPNWGRMNLGQMHFFDLDGYERLSLGHIFTEDTDTPDDRAMGFWGAGVRATAHPSTGFGVATVGTKDLQLFAPHKDFKPMVQLPKSLSPEVRH